MIDKWTVKDAMEKEQDTLEKFEMNLNTDINMASKAKDTEKECIGLSDETG